MRSSQNSIFLPALESRMLAVGITSLAEPAVVGTAMWTSPGAGMGARSMPFLV
jgi:hypothetical protein